MAIKVGKKVISLDDILNKVSEAQILSYYLGIKEIPCLIHSPLRQDKKPSFGVYTNDGKRVGWIDFSNKDRGGTFDLLSKLWNCSFQEVLYKINHDLVNKNTSVNIKKSVHTPTINKVNGNVTLQCKVREWRDYDIKYWESYGIPLKVLKYANVYPISHKIIIKNGIRSIFGADKYAYAFIEKKEDNLTMKIYQPFNKNGFKWSNKHDKSVISLWTKIPINGDKVVICSSVKDALCFWYNTGIPALAIQGEGYDISQTAISELKRRFTNVYILLDNDETGLKDAEKLSQKTGFINKILPIFAEGKDISDLFKYKGKEEFLNIMKKLFN